jgi:hypothetical protein
MKAALSIVLILSILGACDVRREPMAARSPGDEWTNPGGMAMIHSGQEPRRAMRITPARGGQPRVEMILRMATHGAWESAPIDQKMPATRMVFDVTVTDVADNGDVTFVLRCVDTTVFETADVDPRTEGTAAGLLHSMRGVEVTHVLSSRGQALSSEVTGPPGADPMAGQRLSGMPPAPAEYVVPFPEEPIGIGASWRVQSLSNDGVTRVRQAITYTLTAIEGDQVTVTFAIVRDETGDGTAAGRPGLQGSSNSQGTGTTVLRLTEVMPVNSSWQTTSDGTTVLGLGRYAQRVTQSTTMETTVRTLGPEPDGRDAR